VNGVVHFSLHAAGVLAPGLPSLDALRDASRSGSASLDAPQAPLVLPAPSALPANERRRASQVVRLTLACIEQVLATSPFPVETLRSVFATDEGTGEVCTQMLEALATTRQVSPLLFPNSVQNAPSGFFSIAWRNRQSATVASLGQDSFAAGLVCAVTEAVARRQPLLLVSYDPAMSAPLDDWLAVQEPTASAWVLSAGGAPAEPRPLARFSFALASVSEREAAPLPPWLPPRWAAHSSAWSLAALGLIDAAPGSELVLGFGHQRLVVRREADA
jgi:hypothetical protein